MKSRFTSTLATAVALLLALAAQLARAQPQIVLRVHHFLPPESSEALKPWCERIERGSGQRMRCQIVPAMGLGGKPNELFDQARTGFVDISWTLAGYTPGRFPLLEVFELPFMSKSADGTSRALWEYYMRYEQHELKEVKVLALHVHDDGLLHMRSGPVRTLEDLKGKKLRAPSRYVGRLLAALGAEPVTAPLPAMLEGIAKGTLDGTVLPWEAVPPTRLQRLVKFHSETDPLKPALYTAVLIVAMNWERYRSLPPDLRAVIDRNAGVEFSTELGRLMIDGSKPGRKAALDQGNAINVVPYTELARWESLTPPLYAAWVEEMNKQGRPGMDLLLDARALIELYSSPMFGGKGANRR
ncbi:MAG: TRAP transporter substrate-binding protein [Sutterellaceae bacterium]|nr:TRAP transporter substrate-binding protein [Burkholderiaceae bacterium]MDW8430056.1 TRAP transporter substrate-binding protein [Sutterellaceae bacterium]